MAGFNFNRLKEASTWRGLFVLAGVFGLKIAPELQNEIITAVGVIYSFINIFRKG